MTHRKVGVASSLVVALTAGVLTYAAVSSKGETVHETDLDDGSVWVSSSKDARFARVNKAVGQFDGGIATSGGSGDPLDILQDDNAVAGLVLGSGSLTPIDTRANRVAEGSGVSVPAPQSGTNQQVFVPRTVDLRGGTIATVDPKTGKVWGQPYSPDTGLSTLEGLTAGAKPLATVGATAAVAVDVMGGIHAVSGATGKVVSIPRTPTGFGKPVTESIKLESAKVVDITAVGSRWVVYSAGDDKLWAKGTGEAVDAGTTRTEGQPAYAALQQPGPDADSVGLQDSTTLRLIGIAGEGGTGGVEVTLGGNETPPMVSRPLRTGACIHAAWASTTVNYYGKDCGSEQPQPAVSIQRQTTEGVKNGVALRTNHGLVVLNDLDGGEVWDLDGKPKKLDEWDSLIPPPQKEDQNKKKDNIIDETSVAQPPKAEDDNLKARPGRVSKLHVLDNDTDAAGSVLAIDPGDVSRVDVTGVTASVAADGQSIDVSVPGNPERQSFSFTYKINNGKSPQKDEGRVTVTLVGDEVNSPPVLRPGTANLSRKVYPVNAGKVLPVQVIGDWRDPESDPLTLQASAAGSSVDGLGRLNVLAPMKAGTQGVEYAVGDGRDSSKGTVSVKVLDPDEPLVKPQSQPDVVRGVVGKPLQLEPLGNDVPGADPTEPDARLRLSRELQSSSALAVDTNLDTGVVTVTGSSAGTFELSYGAQVGGGIDAGRIRIDLIADPDPNAPPVAVPDSATLRDQTPVLTDVLANDYSPRADVLVTRSVTVSSENGWLRPSIYQGRWVRIEALDPAATGGKPRTGTVSYTISDGAKTTTGEVAVTQLPADDRSTPVVEDDVAVVRAQDSVTIPVMDNDSMADGIPLVLDPASVEVLTGAGSAFASGNVVRFVPKNRNPATAEPVTVEYAVYPIGAKEKATTGRVSITVMPLPTQATPNQPPVARSFSTSVVAGDPLTITVPSSGVDPDGDSVTVDGLTGVEGGAVDLKYGRVTGFGPSTIKYEAYPTAAGTEVLNYVVRDRFGSTSTGFVRIGVVQPGDPQPPVAVEDEVRAKPGKSVTVDATQNDLIARGDSVELLYKAPHNPEAELSKWKVDEANTYFSTKVPDAKAGVQVINYGISNGLFDPSKSTITVIPDPSAKNPPIAVDDTAKPKEGESSTVVDVLANDRDVDGSRESLKVSAVLSPDGTIVEDGTKVQVTVKPYPYTVPYVITDEDGLTGMALIYVPTGESGLPFVVSGALIEMDKDATKKVDLADYVKSPRARVVSITTGDNVSASPADRLRAEADGRSGLTLTSSGGYVGPGSVMLEVSDQETVEQTDFKTTYVSIPVQVGPKIPLLRCPSYSVRLNAGGLARSLDIPTLCHAWVPVGMNLDDVVFESSWKTESKGVSLTRSGTGDRTVELEADDRAPSSADGRLAVKARGGPESLIAVSVLGVDGGAVDANGNPLPTLGPPRLRPFTVTGLEAGSSATVDLRGYLDSPLESPDCAISSAAPSSGSGLSTSFSGCTLTVRAAPEARGNATVTVAATDGPPGRSATGRGTVTILGIPDPPTGVAAEADRVSGGFARVRWAPPALDGGSPITHYVVTTHGPGGTKQSCTASPCTIQGLDNGESYTFTVTAVNAIGASKEGGPSGAVVPDSLPNPVNGVRMAGRGDGSLTVAWTAPEKKGSDVTTYQVRVTDTTSGSVRSQEVAAPTLQAAISGMVNDHQQSVQVRAKNKLGWGPFGSAVKMQSAGTPPAVPAPTVTNAGDGPADGSSRLTISWQSVRPNGPPLTHYTVYESRNGGAWRSIGTTSPDTRTLGHTTVYDGSSYRYVVTATNGANKEGPQSNPTAFSSVGIPEVPGRPSATTPQPNGDVVVRVSVGDSRSTGFTQLQWRTAGSTGNVSCGCAEGSTKQFTILDVGTAIDHNVQVRAYNGRNWSNWSADSNQYRTYHATPAPGNLSSSRNGNDITWTWNNRTDGRNIETVQISINGGGWQSFGGAKESHSINGSAGNTYGLRVRTIANRRSGDAGSPNWWTSPIAGPARESIPDPKPTLTVFQDGYGSDPGGTDSCRISCEKVGLRIANYPPNRSYSVVCSHTKNGTFTSSEKLRTNGSGNGYTWYGSCLFNKNGGTVTVTVGPASDSAPW